MVLLQLQQFAGLALGTNVKFYTSVAKKLKLKVRKIWGLIHTFEEVTGEKLVGIGGGGCPSAPSWIGLNVEKKKWKLWSYKDVWLEEVKETFGLLIYNENPEKIQVIKSVHIF